MECIVGFAGSTGLQAPTPGVGPELPNLRALLALGRVQMEPPVQDQETSLSTPHERAWAQSHGIAAADGMVPLAAALAWERGLAQGLVQGLGNESAWARLTPSHWRLGTEQVSLLDPAQLQLDETESRALFDAARPLIEEAGFALHWVQAHTWLLRHPMLADLPCASLDRVVGRNVDLWLGSDPRSRPLRRLQSEVQMLWHRHPVNEAREARGLDAVNSFWVDGCGVWPTAAQPAVLKWEQRLRSPALAGDEPAWRQAFEHLDATLFARLLHQARSGPPFGLWLCGERRFCRIDGGGAQSRAEATSWWRRWRLQLRRPGRDPSADMRALLESL